MLKELSNLLGGCLEPDWRIKMIADTCFHAHDHKDYDLSEKFDDIRAFLETEFSSYGEMKACYDDHIKRLDEGDAEAENCLDKWSRVEAKMQEIAYGDQDWLYFQNNPVIDISW